ncbi:MAG: hypothetical protein ACK42Y_05455 [Candidatus Thermochlorobacter sp.]
MPAFLTGVVLAGAALELGIVSGEFWSELAEFSPKLCPNFFL